MIVIVDEPLAAAQIRRILAREIARLGDDAPDEFRTAEIIIRRHSSSPVVTALDVEPAHVDDERPMTRAQAARALRCSPSTIDRRAADGALVKIRGGLITAESVRRYQRGSQSR